MTYLKEEKVDKILKSKGYNLLDCIIFYSPVSVWFNYYLMFLFAGIFLQFFFIYSLSIQSFSVIFYIF